MTHLNIQQGSDVEIVSAQIIKKLYDTALTVSEPLEGETDAAYMSGNLLSNKASRKACTYLTTRFPNLHITALEYYIDFEDDVLGNRLISLFSSDGVGVTEADAANATINSTDISDLANSVTSFDEFKYFTKANGNTGNASCRFKDFVNLTSIDLSNLQYLRSCDFLNTAITTVNLESLVGTVSGYGASAFENCTSLTTIQSFGTLNYTPKNCFKGCTSLTTLPNNFFNNITVDFNEGTFYNCTNLVINNPTIKATYIAKNAFANTKLSGTLNCENLTSIGDTAFQNTNLTQVQCLGYIPSVKGFNGCTSLTTVYIPWDAEEITGFNGCSSLTTLRLYDKQLPYVEGETPVFNEISRIKRFGRDCFKNCTGLTNTIDLTDVTYLGLDCFNGAYNLNFIGSTSNIQHWGLDNFLCSTSNRIDLSNVTIVLNSNPDLSNYSSTFYGCKMPSTVTFGEDVTFISSQCFSNTIGLLTVTQTVTDPNKTGITAIDSYAFSKSTIQSVPYTNVQTIGLEAFLECTNLTTINFPSLTSLSGNTFHNCSNLTTVTSLGSITSIPTNTFRNCTSLSSINIPSTVTSYKDNAFDGCTQLSSTIDLTNVVEIRNNAFRNTNVSFTGSTNNITTLGERVFSGKNLSGDLSFPALTTLSKYVFENCTGITKISNLGSVQVLDSVNGGELYGLFLGCTSLTEIIFPTTLKRFNFGIFGTSQNTVGVLKVNKFIFPYGMEKGNLPENVGSVDVNYIQFPSTITSINCIGANYYTNSSNINMYIVVQATTIPSTGYTSNGSFNLSGGRNGHPEFSRWYVPDAKLNDYKAHADWAPFASSIFPISQLETDSPTWWAVYQANKDYGVLSQS